MRLLLISLALTFSTIAFASTQIYNIEMEVFRNGKSLFTQSIVTIEGEPAVISVGGRSESMNGEGSLEFERSVQFLARRNLADGDYNILLDLKLELSYIQEATYFEHSERIVFTPPTLALKDGEERYISKGHPIDGNGILSLKVTASILTPE